VVVTSSVAIAGVLLVFSFLIMPAAIGVLHATTFSRQLSVGWITGTVASAAGLAASYFFDLPTGAAMVCVFGFALALAGIAYPFVHGDRRRVLSGALLALRWGGSLVLAASALQLMAAPRADQPLLDVAEFAAPSLRNLYLSRAEVVTFADARDYAERYRIEAERLNESEIRNRSQGEALDDYMVRRISSFLKSYGEMRKGEQFVMNVVRARARDRWPGFAGIGAIVGALVLAPPSLAAAENPIKKRPPFGGLCVCIRQAFQESEAHAASTHAAAGRHCRCRILRQLSDHRLGGDEQAGNRAGILQGSAYDLGGIDDTRIDHIDIFFFLSVEAVGFGLVVHDLAHDD
jgi:zinc/manganese transport system permease protein